MVTVLPRLDRANDNGKPTVFDAPTIQATLPDNLTSYNCRISRIPRTVQAMNEVDEDEEVGDEIKSASCNECKPSTSFSTQIVSKMRRRSNYLGNGN
ncbi:unnamed protein product [Rotaria sp. Silwood2]|nr:unnamed protein product [Rotaria sp. Silwood2]